MIAGVIADVRPSEAGGPGLRAPAMAPRGRPPGPAKNCLVNTDEACPRRGDREWRLRPQTRTGARVQLRSMSHAQLGSPQGGGGACWRRPHSRLPRRRRGIEVSRRSWPRGTVVDREAPSPEPTGGAPSLTLGPSCALSLDPSRALPLGAQVPGGMGRRTLANCDESTSCRSRCLRERLGFTSIEAGSVCRSAVRRRVRVAPVLGQLRHGHRGASSGGTGGTGGTGGNGVVIVYEA